MMRNAIKLMLFVLLVMSSPRLIAQTRSLNNKKTIDRAMRMVESLPEVKGFLVTAKKDTPEVLVAGEPDANCKFYWIKVGLGNLGTFRTAYNFYVDPKTFQVFYLDLMVDDGNSSQAIITLKQWRYLRTKPGFNKMHYYRHGKMIVSPQ